MSRICRPIVAAAAMIVSFHALGAEPVAKSSAAGGSAAAPSAARPPSARLLTPKRRLIACMTKEMSVSRTISYNDAVKVCKSQGKTDGATLAASPSDRPMIGMGQ